MLIPVPAGFRRRHGRAKAKAPASDSLVTVVAVQFVDEFHVYWKFSSAVVSYDDPTGLTVGGQSPGSVDEITAEGWMLVGYNSEVAGGDLWEVTGSVAILFAGEGELELPESGTVTS